MTLPRFTKGQAGNLDFSALNEAFEAIDNLRRGGERPPARFQPRAAAGAAGPIMVKINDTPADPADYRWGFKEVELINVAPTATADPPSWGIKFGGANSDGNTSPVVGKMVRGEYCLISKQIGSSLNGSLPYYIPTREMFDPFYAKITSSTTGGTGNWTYWANKVFLLGANVTDTGLNFQCHNTAELILDDTTVGGFGYGVGFNKPSQVQYLSRKQIRNGVIVLMTRTLNENRQFVGHHFTMPNPYSVTC